MRFARRSCSFVLSIVLTGCVAAGAPAEDAEEVDPIDGSFRYGGGPADGFGVTDESLEGCTVLRVANEATLEEIDVDAGLDARAARAIVAKRPFDTLAELDAAPYVGQIAFDRLLVFGEGSDYACDGSGQPETECTATGGTYDGVRFDRDEECRALAFMNHARFSDMRSVPDAGRKAAYDLCPGGLSCGPYRSAQWRSVGELAALPRVAGTSIQAIKSAAASWEPSEVWYDTVADVWARRAELRDAPITFEKVYVARSLGEITDGSSTYVCVEIRDSESSPSYLPACLQYIDADSAPGCTNVAGECMDGLIHQWVWLRGTLRRSYSLPGGYRLNLTHEGGRDANPELAAEELSRTCRTEWCAITNANAPTRRANAATVWTGSEMFVWSGDAYDTGSPDGETLGQDWGGGLYHPVANAWRSMRPGGAPGFRRHASAVWTGSEVIVWGGEEAPTGGAAIALSTGGRYDPALDAWSPMTDAGAPAPRLQHIAVWTGREMIVWGGVDAGRRPVAGGKRYDPASDRWRTMSSTGAPSPRAGAAAVWTGAELVVWGGVDASGPRDDGYRYDPVADRWRAISTTGAPSPRGGAAAVWTGREVVVWGGRAGATHPSDGARFDPATNTWARIATTGAPIGRVGHAFVWTGTSAVVIGGSNEAVSELSAKAWNAETNRWVALPPSDVPIARGASVVWTGEWLLRWGGIYGMGLTRAGARVRL